jgi:hypothetical protein
MTTIAAKPLRAGRTMWLVFGAVAVAVLIAGSYFLGRMTTTRSGHIIAPVRPAAAQPAPVHVPPLHCRGLRPC